MVQMSETMPKMNWICSGCSVTLAREKKMGPIVQWTVSACFYSTEARD